MDIDQHPPKSVQYSILLYIKFGNGGFFKNLARRFKGKKPDHFTKSEIKEFLQSHYNQDCSTSISNFLQQLEKDEIIVKKGSRENENGMNVDTWKLDKEKLEKELLNTSFMSYFTGDKTGFHSNSGESFLKKMYYGHPYKD
jgi:hypothetical protein